MHYHIGEIFLWSFLLWIKKYFLVYLLKTFQFVRKQLEKEGSWGNIIFQYSINETFVPNDLKNKWQ